MADKLVLSEVVELLREEVKEKLGAAPTKDKDSLDFMSKLPYLHAVVSEVPLLTIHTNNCMRFVYTGAQATSVGMIRDTTAATVPSVTGMSILLPF